MLRNCQTVSIIFLVIFAGLWFTSRVSIWIL